MNRWQESPLFGPPSKPSPAETPPPPTSQPAVPPELARDRQARAAAQTRFDRPLVLEAGAGTGKTTTLIARLLAWCLGPGWERAAAAAPHRGAPAPAPPRADEVVAARVLRRVVALTFTEAAAAEMAERAARELAALARGAPAAPWMGDAALPEAGELARRARALVATLDHLSIETIHAYCFRLLAAHPLEAGVHPNLQIDVDGSLVEQAIADTVEGALRTGYGAPGDPHLLALAADGVGPREVAEALAVLVAAGLPAAALRRDPFTAGDSWPRLRWRVARAATALEELLVPRLAGGRLKLANAIAAALAQLAQAASAEPAAPDSALPAGDPTDGLRQAARQGFPSNLRHRLADWGKGSFTRQEEGVLGDTLQVAERSAALARLLEQVERLDPARLSAARLALAPLLEQATGELARRGVVSFDDLLRGARRLLAEHSEVRARLRRGMDQLLVDEFQDTDVTQCEVLRWLALDGPAEERPGLFLVGDPKQSIYGWRSADLRAYGGFVAAVVAGGGQVLPLVENFRSLPAILDEVTRVMAPVMRERAGVQPPFVPLIPCAERAAGAAQAGSGRRAVEHWVSWPPEGDPATARDADLAAATALEAEAIAGDLAALRAELGAPWSEVAILLRSTGDLDVYLDALRRRGIPFAVGRDAQYFRRREVIDAAALVRAVLDPGDHLALVTLLRSPMVGVPDAALIPLWRHQLPRLMTELDAPTAERLAAIAAAIAAALREVPADIPGLHRVAGWDRSLLAAVEHLSVLRESFAAEPVDLFVERLRRLLLLDVSAAARYLGAYRLANLDRFFRLLLAEIDRGGDATAVLRALRVRIASGREADEGRPLAGAEDAVAVLTIHGAKGLDFTHVYLAQLHKPGRKDAAPATAAGRLQVSPAGGADPLRSATSDGRDGSGEGRGAADEIRGWEYSLFGAATPELDRLEERRREVEAAERVRTLYVAMTRAKDRLVLAACWPRRDAPPPAVEQARSHLHLLAWRPGCPDLQWLWQADSSSLGGDFVDDDGVVWRFPALAAWAAPAVVGAPEPAGWQPIDPAAVAAQAAGHDRHLAAAAARMASPFGAAASEEAHAELREDVAGRTAADASSGSAAGPGSGFAAGSSAAVAAPGAASGSGSAAGVAADLDLDAAAAREAAMEAGAAFHRAVELWDLGAEPRAEAERQRALLPAYLAAVTPGRDAGRSLARAAAMLERFVDGGLADRLCGLAAGVVARELPVLLAPSPPSPPGSPWWPSLPGPAPPVGFLSGTIDLLYRDPASGVLVVADYKTDDVRGAALEERAAIYASQGAAYVAAVQAALDLPAPPRFELWFVHAGLVVEPAPAGGGAR